MSEEPREFEDILVDLEGHMAVGFRRGNEYFLEKDGSRIFPYAWKKLPLGCLDFTQDQMRKMRK